jgi:hypothetical protein
MNRMRSVRRWLLVSTAAGALVFPAAGARGAQGPKAPGGKPAPPVVVEVSRDHFDWQDAGVGAAAMLALVAIGFGGTLVVRDRPGPVPVDGKEVRR